MQKNCKFYFYFKLQWFKSERLNIETMSGMLFTFILPDQF